MEQKFKFDNAPYLLVKALIHGAGTKFILNVIPRRPHNSLEAKDFKVMSLIKKKAKEA